MDYDKILGKQGDPISFYDRRPGKCKFWVDGRICGTEFQGPRNRKYCDAHSQRIKLSGRTHGANGSGKE